MIARRESDGGSSSQAQALRSFASYIERVLKAIKDNLESKSKLYEESKALKGKHTVKFRSRAEQY